MWALCILPVPSFASGPLDFSDRLLMHRGERRINLLAGLVERLLAGLHPGEDALGGRVERLLDLRVGRAAPDAGYPVARPRVEQPGDLAQGARPLEEGIVLQALERGQG